MDRIELATQLISKGVELLDESAGRNGVAERYREEHLKNMTKEISDLKAKAKMGKLTDDEEKRLDKLRYNKMYVKGAKGGNDISNPESKYLGSRAAKAKANGADFFYEGNKKLGKDAAAWSKEISDGNANKRMGMFGMKPSSFRHYDGVERYDRSDRKVNPIHDKINKRAKSQNETVADLLTEAAYLLSLVDNDDE